MKGCHLVPVNLSDLSHTCVPIPPGYQKNHANSIPLPYSKNEHTIQFFEKFKKSAFRLRHCLGVRSLVRVLSIWTMDYSKLHNKKSEEDCGPSHLRVHPFTRGGLVGLILSVFRSSSLACLFEDTEPGKGRIRWSLLGNTRRKHHGSDWEFDLHSNMASNLSSLLSQSKVKGEI